LEDGREMPLFRWDFLKGIPGILEHPKLKIPYSFSQIVVHRHKG
jgi:hypothetical protein